jgi:hypothetical protein
MKWRDTTYLLFCKELSASFGAMEIGFVSHESLGGSIGCEVAAPRPLPADPCSNWLCLVLQTSHLKPRTSPQLALFSIIGSGQETGIRNLVIPDPHPGRHRLMMQAMSGAGLGIVPVWLSRDISFL